MTLAQVIEADWTWIGDRFESGVRIDVGESGRIREVGRLPQPATRRLVGRAVLPGLVNVHSHAFQRALRGRGETFPKGAGTFWTWREAMYALVNSLDPDSFYDWSRRAFEEMLACGITTVGEFHYLHHVDADLQDCLLDDALLSAARDAGIRLVFLYTYYRTGGVGKPLEAGQQRFRCHSPEEFWQRFDRSASRLQDHRQSIGAAVHSLRAAPLEDLVSIHREADRRGLVFHIHVEEQRREIEDCRAVHGAAPMRLIVDHLGVNERFTSVHCTHTASADLEEFLARGGTACLCPSTEGNLGDGVPDVPRILSADGSFALGTDSNVRLCMTEDMRWMEYAQRLRGETRGSVVDSAGSVAARLFLAGTAHGARSLGVSAGTIEANKWADLIAIDLNAASLLGWTPETLMDTWVFGTGDGIVSERCVGGQWT